MYPNVVMCCSLQSSIFTIKNQLTNLTKLKITSIGTMVMNDTLQWLILLFFLYEKHKFVP